MVRLTDRPDMTLDVCRGRETTIQQCIVTEGTKPENSSKVYAAYASSDTTKVTQYLAYCYLQAREKLLLAYFRSNKS